MALSDKYIPRTHQLDPNLFIEEYYSGSDTKIYIDGVEQTEISQIQFTIQEQLKPFYGYNSRTWDEIAVGNRIVIGTLTMPIKNTQENATLKEVWRAGYEWSREQEIINFNDSESWKKDEQDWVQDDNTVWTKPEEDDEQTAFSDNQLNLLKNYTKDGIYKMSEDELRNLVRSIQQLSGELELTGELDTDTLAWIENDLATKGKGVHPVQRARLFVGPGTDYAFVRNVDTDKILILYDDKPKQGYYYVSYSEGTEIKYAWVSAEDIGKGEED